MHIDLTKINGDFELSFSLHRFITHHIHLAWTLRFNTEDTYFTGEQAFTLSHHLHLTRNDDLNDDEFQTPQYTVSSVNAASNKMESVGTLFLYTAGLCYFQDKEKLLAPEGMDTIDLNKTRLNTIAHTLLSTLPWRHYGPIQNAQNEKLPLPHIREYETLHCIYQKTQALNTVNPKQATPLICLLADRIKHYQAMYDFQQTWRRLIINPTQCEPNTEKGTLLAGYLSLLDMSRTYRITHNTSLPFRGKQLKLTHQLVHRLKHRGQHAFDVVDSGMLVGEGSYGTINERVSVLTLDHTKPCLSTQAPKHLRLYKEVQLDQDEDLDNEFSRSQSIDYLNPKNNHHLLFSMRALPGTNLHCFIKSKQFQTLPNINQVTLLLELAYQSYAALNQYIANNEKLDYCHGDIKPKNMMVSLTETNAVTVRFIDFDKGRRSRLYYPLIFRQTSQAMDCYCLIRTLAFAFRDTHPIWGSTTRIDAFKQYHQQGIEALLKPLFVIFDNHLANHCLSSETVVRLKTIFTELHDDNNADYPSAEKIADEFKAIYNEHCAWLKENPCSDHRLAMKA